MLLREKYLWVVMGKDHEHARNESKDDEAEKPEVIPRVNFG
jgi:hypothetical protein